MAKLDYYLTFQSIDYGNRIVHGNLELRFGPMFHIVTDRAEAKCRYGPLEYDDGMPVLRTFGFIGPGFIKKNVLRLAKTEEFKEQEPTAVKFKFELVGEPKFYPFDAYLLAGAAKCMVKCVPETLKNEGQEDITVTQDIPGFLIRNARFDEVKQIRQWPKESEDEIKIEKSDFMEWNKENTFLLVLYRPLFLRFMTVFLGVVAFLSVLYIALLRPLKDIPMNAMAYFIALWAIREILYHGTTVFPTLVDYGVLFLYSCLIIAAISRWIWPEKKHNQKEG